MVYCQSSLCIIKTIQSCYSNLGWREIPYVAACFSVLMLYQKKTVERGNSRLNRERGCNRESHWWCRKNSQILTATVLLSFLRSSWIAFICFGLDPRNIKMKYLTEIVSDNTNEILVEECIALHCSQFCSDFESKSPSSGSDDAHESWQYHGIHWDDSSDEKENPPGSGTTKVCMWHASTTRLRSYPRSPPLFHIVNNVFKKKEKESRTSVEMVEKQLIQILTSCTCSSEMAWNGVHFCSIRAWIFFKW